jgi:acetyl CoA:N6-hydroxylysine acetyl transferase
MSFRPPSESEMRTFLAGNGTAATISRSDSEVRVASSGAALMNLAFSGANRLKLLSAPDDSRLALRALSAAFEAVFGWNPGLGRLGIDVCNYDHLADELRRQGLAVSTESGLAVLPELAMQLPHNWLANPDRPAFPPFYEMTGGKRHPRRAPKPEGLAYARFIPWLAQVISFRAIDLDGDLPLIHRWMNDPRVASAWQEEGDLDKHRKYLSGLLADPHMLPMIGSFDGVPFGYFEIYWAKENRLAPFYDADDYDRGWHVLVGEDAYRGRRFISAWLPSLMHYMFLDDCRTQRIVGEPAASHRQQLRNLEVSGFARIKNFDFPHKRATLVMLLRERFFGDRLWLPAPTESIASTIRANGCLQ